MRELPHTVGWVIVKINDVVVLHKATTVALTYKDGNINMEIANEFTVTAPNSGNVAVLLNLEPYKTTGVPISSGLGYITGGDTLVISADHLLPPPSDVDIAKITIKHRDNARERV